MAEQNVYVVYFINSKNIFVAYNIIKTDTKKSAGQRRNSESRKIKSILTDEKKMRGD